MSKKWRWERIGNSAFGNIYDDNDTLVVDKLFLKEAVIIAELHNLEINQESPAEKAQRLINQLTE